MARRGLALGCGGTVGGAWLVGALHAVQEALDWDARDAAAIIGTSAGATTAAMLGAGVSVSEMVDGQRGAPLARESVRRFFTHPPRMLPSVPFGLPSPGLSFRGVQTNQLLPSLAGLLPAGRSDAGFLDALIDDLEPQRDWVAHPATWIAATDLDSGERAFFGKPGHPVATLRDAVRASWAIPGWYPPVEIGGRKYLDGGVTSTASADALVGLGLEEVIVIAPMASLDGARVPGLGGRVEGVMRSAMTAVLDAEVAALEAGGTRVIRVHPGADELVVMGPNFMSPRRRLQALEIAQYRVPDQLSRVTPGQGPAAPSAT